MDQSTSDYKGPERRINACFWPNCQARDEAKTYHEEVRGDLQEIKGFQQVYIEEMKKTTMALTQIVAIQLNATRLEEKHDKDFKAINTRIDGKLSRKEFFTYSSIVIGVMALLETLHRLF